MKYSMYYDLWGPMLSLFKVIIMCSFRPTKLASISLPFGRFYKARLMGVSSLTGSRLWVFQAMRVMLVLSLLLWTVGRTILVLSWLSWSLMFMSFDGWNLHSKWISISSSFISWPYSLMWYFPSIGMTTTLGSLVSVNLHFLIVASFKAFHLIEWPAAGASKLIDSLLFFSSPFLLC